MRRKSRTRPCEIRPTDEQEAIIRTELKVGECALINAYAGTGKTSTLEMLANAHSGKRILYICFNRETALQAKVEGGVSAIVTRNQADYSASEIPIQSPEEYLANREASAD